MYHTSSIYTTYHSTSTVGIATYRPDRVQAWCLNSGLSSAMYVVKKSEIGEWCLFKMSTRQPTWPFDWHVWHQLGVVYIRKSFTFVWLHWGLSEWDWKRFAHTLGSTFHFYAIKTYCCIGYMVCEFRSFYCCQERQFSMVSSNVFDNFRHR